MASYKPLVLISGQISQLSGSDSLDAQVNETEGVPLTNGESSLAITIGMPVYLTTSASTCKMAKGDAIGTAHVFGLVKSASISTGNTGTIVTSGQLSSTDWTSVVGSTTLSIGLIYYLSNAAYGQMTTTPPTTGISIELGQAISTTAFQIRISRTIAL